MNRSKKFLSLFLALALFGCNSNDKPITFYGKLIDQNGAPVAGAKVDISVPKDDTSAGATKSKKFNLETDDKGVFSLSGAAGSAVQIASIVKPGYQLSPKTHRMFVYASTAPFKPDANNPVAFSMWKLAGKQPLDSVVGHIRVACDDTTNHYDLLTGSNNADGILQLACVRTPLALPKTGNRRSDYEMKIAITGGGLQLASDDFKNLAPENGYEPMLTFGKKADAHDWSGKVSEDFYFKTADGHYGRFHLDWLAAQKLPNHLDWNGVVNPSGSRVLEH